ncbi:MULTISPECIES: fimbrial protein [Serratia]|uniref:fimbrial protein n=1 Tax=Serratia TaxID=613 RepID=UPI000742D7E9|nr:MULTISPECIES: fimbrial protein [Serratia]ALX93602.1 oxidoreductase [Serratia fonticola]QXN63132.1 type 1 fimbrial protein [Serratia fonticola]UAN58598.1 type 1 fimbrial protein [Serratia sp. JSRIV004]UAN63929.1 type 1 fimbrial protein [Serratia sp. JSRIV006]CAI0830845.1 fimbrial protein [Serratia fonticola]
MNKILQYMTGVLVCMAVGNSAWAAVVCSPLNGAPRTDTVQLSPPAISAGTDIPVGTVIYQGRWISGETGLSVMKCASAVDTSMWFNIAWSIDQAPMPLANWSGSPFAGAVYQTNIPGVGVAISRSPDSEAFILGQPFYRFPSDTSSPVTGGSYEPYLTSRDIYVSLIKIGTIAPGNYILDSAKLPTPSISITNPLSHPATTGLPIKAYIVKLQGQLTVSAQTCTTPDVNVNLGSFDINKNFTGRGATTPWVDASIALTNCPTFFGFYNVANSTLMFDYTLGGGKVANSTNNSIGVRLTPTTSVIDAANGIMAIDSSVSGAAAGVGIQIGWGNSSQTPTLFNFAGEQTLTLPKDGSPTIRVPLAARYIQTATSVSPGKANGKVVFTINYY